MRLVAVSGFGSVSLREPGGLEPRVLVPRGGNWPAASHLGVLAVPVAATRPGEVARVRLFGLGGDAGDVPGSVLGPGLGIAPGLTHYVYWSPQGTRLLVVQPAHGALELRSWNPGMPKSQPILAGAPVFATFDDSGSLLAIHHGTGSGPRLTVLELPPVGPGRVSLVEHGVGGFGAPAFCRRGQMVAWAEPRRTGVQLRAAELATGRILDGPVLDGAARFVPGPVCDDVLVAVADPVEPAMYGRLLAWDPETAAIRTLYRGRFLAAWASPGRGPVLIALAVPGFALESKVQLCFVDQSGRELARLEPFVPSQAMQLALAFFDQFGRSHSPWSPGGEWFVVAGRHLSEGPFPLFGPAEPDRVLGVRAADIGVRSLTWRVLAEGALGWLVHAGSPGA